MVTQNTTTGAATAARHIQLTQPQANQQIVIDNIAGAALDMAFPSEAAQLEQSGQDLVFLFENGGRIVLSNFFGLFESNQLPAFNLEDGQSLPGDAFLAALREDLLPAAGPGAGAAAGSGGVGDYTDDAGNLIGGVDRLDPLGTTGIGTAALPGIEDVGTLDPANGTLLITISTGVTTEIPGQPGEVPPHPDQVPAGSYAGVFEDWQPNQHLLGNLAQVFSAQFGFTFTPDDNEVLNTITFVGPIAGTLLVNGAEVAPDGAGNFVISAADIGNVTLLPLADSGTDIPLSGFASITDPDSGLTGTVPFTFTAVVDAVADQPMELGNSVSYGPFESIPGGEEQAMEQLARGGGYNPPSHDAPNGEGLTAGNPGDTMFADDGKGAVNVTLSATFGDYQDGSETHYLIIEKKADWTYEKVIYPDTGPDTDLTDLEPYEVSGQYLLEHYASIDSGSIKAGVTYYVIPVGDESIVGPLSSYVDAQGLTHQTATKSITLVMYPPNEAYQPYEGGEGSDTSRTSMFGGDNHDYQELFVTGALAVDTDADGNLTTVNDTSLVVGSVTVEVAPADGSFVVTGQHWGLEDPQAYAHDPGHGSLKDIDLDFKFTPDDNEVLDKIEIALDIAKGTILVGGAELKEFGAEEGQKSYYVTGEEGQRIYTIDADDMHRVTLMPPAHSDVDVTLSVTAHFHDPDSGDTAEKKVEHTVLIDAVADKPDVSVSLIQPEEYDRGEFDGSYQYGEKGLVHVDATFGDYTDGSETHYVKLCIPEGFTVLDKAGGEMIGNMLFWKVENTTDGSFQADVKVQYFGDDNSGKAYFTAEAVAIEGAVFNNYPGGPTSPVYGKEWDSYNNVAGDSATAKVYIKDADPHASKETIIIGEGKVNVADPSHDGTELSPGASPVEDHTLTGHLDYGFGYSDPATPGAFKWSVPTKDWWGKNATETDTDDSLWVRYGSYVLKSDGHVVNWQVSADGQTLIGYVGTNPVEGAAVIKVEMSNLATGEYKVTLLGHVDHPDNEARSGVGDTRTGSDSDSDDVLKLEIPYTVTDEFGRTANSTLSVSIEDDAPVACPTSSAFTVATNAGEELVFQLAPVDGHDDVISLLGSHDVDLRVDGGTPFFSSSGLGVTYDGKHVADGPMSPDRENEVGYRDDKLVHEQEGVVFKLDGVANSFSLSASAFFRGGDGGEGELGTVRFYLGDTLVQTKYITAASLPGDASAGTFNFTGLPLYDRVVVSGNDTNSSNAAQADNSDFYITNVAFGMVSQIGTSSGDLRLEYGADGPASSGSLSISFDDKTQIWTLDGHKVNVVSDGNGLKGIIAGTADVAFTMSIDATGKWIFTQKVPLDLPGTSNPGGSGSDNPGYALSNLQFKYTAYDGDGDKFSGTFNVKVFEVERAPDIDMPAVAHVVYEKGLTSVDDHSETVTGSFTIDMQGEAFAGSNAIKVGGKVFSSLDELKSDNTLFIGLDGNVTTEDNAIGKLDVIDWSQGSDGKYEVQYTYTLLHNVDHNFPDGGVTGNIIPVEVKDASDDTASATLTIAIVDDVPKAYDNANSVTEDSGTGPIEAKGDLIVDAQPQADTVGADGNGHITAISFGANEGRAAAGGGWDVDGQYGTLHVNADGTYTYTLHNNATVVQALSSSDHPTETFTYTLADGDGDTAQAHLTVTVNGADEPRILSIGEVPEGHVYEADLAGGSGWEGNGLISGGQFTITSSSGLTGLKIGTETVNLALPDGDHQNISTDHGRLTITDVNHDGDVYTVTYTYTLTQTATNPDADHNGVNEAFKETLQIKATDSTGTATHDLVVNIVDDHPTAVADVGAYPGKITTNLVLVLDVSGSMDDPSGVAGTSRLELARDAIEQMLDAYQGLGAVNIKLVWFSSGADTTTEGWLQGADAVERALDTLNKLVADGSTNYDAAIDLVVSGLSPAGTVPAANSTVMYFLSDGEPNTSGSWLDSPGIHDELGNPEQTKWQTFLQESSLWGDKAIDRVYALGIGTGIGNEDIGELNPIGWERGSSSDANVVAVIQDMTGLAPYLVGTVPITGNLISGGTGGVGADASGADGWPATGKVASVIYDGHDYTVSGGNHDAGTWSGHLLTLILDDGKGKLTINFDTGAYLYTPGAQPTGTVNLGYTAADADGSTSPATLTLTLSSLDAHDNNEAYGATVADPLSEWEVTNSSDSGAEVFVSGGTARFTIGNNESGTLEETIRTTSDYTTMGFKWNFNRSSGASRDATGDKLLLIVSKVGSSDDPRTIHSADLALTADGMFFYTFAAAGDYTLTFMAQDDTSSSSNRDFTATISDVQFFNGVNGNVVTDHHGTDQQDVLGGHAASITEVNGHSVASTGFTVIGGEHGDLYINSAGKYHYARHDDFTGDDVFVYKLASTTAADHALLTIHAGSESTVSHNMVYGTSGSETLNGTAGDDVMMGFGGADTLNGLGGHDLLIGGGGHDILNGGDGNDVLIGGHGSDTLTGGADHDTFIWNTEDFTADARDVVTDFDINQDVLRFSDVLLDSNSGRNGIQLEISRINYEGDQQNQGNDVQITLHHSGAEQTVVLQNVIASGANVNDTLQDIEQHILNHKIITEHS